MRRALETAHDAAASEDSSQSLVSPRQWEAASLCNRSFPRAGEFEAYHDCERWLYEQGCAIGSMQRAAPIGVMFEPGHSIAKSRNLGADAADMHGWITFPGGVGPRAGDVRFTITKLGYAFLTERSDR